MRMDGGFYAEVAQLEERFRVLRAVAPAHTEKDESSNLSRSTVIDYCNTSIRSTKDLFFIFSWPIPVRAFTFRAYLWTFLLIARNPLMLTSLTMITS